MLQECLTDAQTGFSGEEIDAAKLWCVPQSIDRHVDYSHKLRCVLQGEVRFHGAAVLGDGVLSRRYSAYRWTQDAFPVAPFCQKPTARYR